MTTEDMADDAPESAEIDDAQTVVADGAAEAPEREEPVGEQPDEDLSKPEAEAPSGNDAPGLVLCVGISEAGKQRLLDATTADLTDDDSRAGEATAALVSTRGWDPDAPGAFPEGVPVLVLCHPGGETAAIDMMARGAIAVLAEGDEAGVGRYLGQVDGPPPLLEAFMEHGPSTAVAAEAVHGPVEFGRRIGSVQDGVMPRILLTKIANYPAARSRAGSEAMAAIMRRLEVSFTTLARRVPAEPYRIDEAAFALIGADLSVDDAQEVAQDFAAIAGAYAPATVALIPASGHAGPEVASTSSALWDLAQRAADAAAKIGSSLLDAQDLSTVMASEMELEAVLRVARQAEVAAGFSEEHGGVVARLARGIAEHLGFDRRAVEVIALAALLRNVGVVGEDDPERRNDRTVRFVEVTAGPEVADIIAHRGDGVEDGDDGSDTPEGSKVLAVAEALADLVDPADGASAKSLLAAVDELARGDHRFDPKIVEVARLVGMREGS